MAKLDFDVAAAVPCALGENPLWHHESQSLYWTDITAGAIYRLNPRGLVEKIYSGDPVGGFTFESSGDLLLFRVSDIALLSPRDEVRMLHSFSHPGMERFNDVIADPEGRVFAGTLGTNPFCGLCKFDHTLSGGGLLFAGSGCSNGLGFSPDRKWIYWTCSTRGTIYKFPYSQDLGLLGAARVFTEPGGEEGIPDGLTVDADGFVWSARWGAGLLVQYSPEGRIQSRHRLPVLNVSSVCFGGSGLNRLFITTARHPQHNHPSAGFVFTAQAPCAGLPEFRSRLSFQS